MAEIKKAQLAKIKFAAAIAIAVVMLILFAQEFFPEDFSDFITGMSVAVKGDESQPNSTITVAAIRMHRDDFSIDSLKSKLGALFKAHPTVDLVVTPEYSLYDEYKSHPVMIGCIRGLCTVQSIGSSKSLELKLAIKEIALIAKQKNTNIMLGTVAEMDTISARGIIYNTMLVISRNGVIIGKSRKFEEILLFEELLNPRFCSIKDVFCSSVKVPASALVLGTMEPLTLSSAGGAVFKAVPIICTDKDNENVIKKLSNSSADIIILSEFHSTDYITLTSESAKGENIFKNPNGNVLFLKRLFFGEYVNKNITRQNSYLIASNSEPKGGSAGILSISRNEIRNLDITSDFVYGEITIDLPEPSEAKADGPFEESPAQVFDEEPEEAAANESQSKTKPAELQKQGIFSRIKNFILGIFS
jgi:hypothetical protein